MDVQGDDKLTAKSEPLILQADLFRGGKYKASNQSVHASVLVMSWLIHTNVQLTRRRSTQIWKGSKTRTSASDSKLNHTSEVVTPTVPTWRSMRTYFYIMWGNTEEFLQWKILHKFYSGFPWANNKRRLTTAGPERQDLISVESFSKTLANRNSLILWNLAGMFPVTTTIEGINDENILLSSKLQTGPKWSEAKLLDPIEASSGSGWSRIQLWLVTNGCLHPKQVYI